jgi:4-alpha-glucanotransferase
VTTMDVPDDILRRRADELGVMTRYVSVDGEVHDADVDALRFVVDLLDADTPAGGGATIVQPVVVTDRGVSTTVTVDAEVSDAELLLDDGTDVRVEVAHDRRSVTLPGDLPLGCHELRIDAGARRSTSTIVVAPRTMPRLERLERRSGLFVPAYALWDVDHPLPSFGMLGRLAAALPSADTHVLTTLPLYATFLDDPFDPSPYSPISRLHWSEVFLDDSTLPPAGVPSIGRYLDWRALAARRRAQLVEAATTADTALVADLEAFVARRPDIDRFARFMVGRAGSADPLVHRSHVLAQYLADRQLASITSAEHATLAIDLPIGCHPDGYERWAHPELFAAGVSIGAPPDTFFREGQDWGLPPQLPAAGRRSGHRLWRDLLERAGEHASLLRIDHAMAVHRLWWVPHGFGADRGVYVHYPREELLAVIAATAARTSTTVVGEDLGTVPVEVSDAFERWDMLGMYEEQFHTDEGELADIPARTVAGIRTHDMQAFAAFVAEQGPALDGYRERLARQVGHEVASSYGDVLDAVLERLAASASSLVTVDVDDLLGETEAHNVPGRVLDTTWRRRLDRPISDLLTDPELERRLRTLGARS